jgi:Aromatic-ring-opening dioxygenase LigAB, LigA subunit
MRDYWLNKLFFDLQQPDLAAQYKNDRAAVLARYPMSAELRRAVESDDIAVLAPHVNAYLLRFYFAICGMKDAEFIRRLNEIPKAQAVQKGKEGVSRHG